MHADCLEKDKVIVSSLCNYLNRVHFLCIEEIKKRLPDVERDFRAVRMLLQGALELIVRWKGIGRYA